MPGTPFPVLGSTLATVLVAAAAGFAVTAVVWSPGLRRRVSSRRAFAGAVGVSYAVVTIALWAVVRLLAYPSAFVAYGNAIAFWLALAVLGAVALGGGAAYIYARFRYVTALLSLFAATAFTWYVFLRVGGETDALWVWAFVFVPVLVAGAVALLVVEWLLRRLLGIRGGGGVDPAA